MSNAMLTAVFDHSRTRNAARLLMLALADRADDHGKAWPSIADLMRRTGISRGALHNAMREAVRLGELSVENFAGPRLCNLYVLSIPTRSESEPVQNVNPVQILNRPVQNQDKTRSESEPKPLLTLKNPQSLDREMRKAKKTKPEPDADFKTFWQTYPRRVNKPAAVRAWLATAKERPPLAALLAALAAHKRNWRDPKFIPHPASWLNGHRWQDQIETPLAVTGAKTGGPSSCL